MNEVAPKLLLAFKAMLAWGLTSKYINKGMITLIMKSGDHSKQGIGAQSHLWEAYTISLPKL